MLSFNWLESHPAEEVHVDEKPPEEGGNDKITGAEEYTYTYLVSGWDRSTDIPLLPADDQASGPGMIVVLLLLLLLVLGRNRSENILLTLTHSCRLDQDPPVCALHHLPGQGGKIQLLPGGGDTPGGVLLPCEEGWTGGGDGGGGDSRQHGCCDLQARTRRGGGGEKYKK